MAMGRKAPRGKRGGCTRGNVKVEGYAVTKKIRVKSKTTGKLSKNKKAVSYTVDPYCRKKAAKKAAAKKKTTSGASGSKASANFVCQSNTTKRFTRRTANGQCRAGSKKIRI
jgi:hypothetical protein